MRDSDDSELILDPFVPFNLDLVLDLLTSKFNLRILQGHLLSAFVLWNKLRWNLWRLSSPTNKEVKLSKFPCNVGNLPNVLAADLQCYTYKAQNWFQWDERQWKKVKCKKCIYCTHLLWVPIVLCDRLLNIYTSPAPCVNSCCAYRFWVLVRSSDRTASPREERTDQFYFPPWCSRRSHRGNWHHDRKKELLWKRWNTWRAMAAHTPSFIPKFDPASLRRRRNKRWPKVR